MLLSERLFDLDFQFLSDFGLTIIALLFLLFLIAAFLGFAVVIKLLIKELFKK